MWYEEILRNVIVFLFGVLATIWTQRMLDKEKNMKKSKIVRERKSDLRLNWNWAKAYDNYHAFAYEDIWYQNLSNLGVTLKKIRFKSSDHDKDVEISAKIEGGQLRVEANGPQVKFMIYLSCKLLNKEKESLPVGKGVMILEIEDANQEIESFSIPYEFFDKDR